jgi:hypothetical protein
MGGARKANSSGVSNACSKLNIHKTLNTTNTHALLDNIYILIFQASFLFGKNPAF